MTWFSSGSSNPGGDEWVVGDDTIREAEEAFANMTLTPDGRAGGAAVKGVLLATGLDVGTLKAIWNLSSIDGKGSLDNDEMALALHLSKMATQGESLPDRLPLRFVPPSKRASPLFAQ